MNVNVADPYAHRLSRVQPLYVSNARRRSELRPVERQDGLAAVSDDFIQRASVVDPRFGALVTDSKLATEQEKDLSLRDSLRLYKPAAAWSIAISTAVVMIGYDSVLIISLFGQPSFTANYANQTDSNSQPTISASWKSALTNAILVGEIVGLSLTGIILDRIGYKRTIAAALLFLAAAVFITFFARNIEMLLAGQVLCGLPWGAFSIATTSYASDVAPVALRAYLTTYVNICWSIGQLIEAGVMRAMLERTDQWAYRIPFAVQWTWPIPLFVAAYLMPESPWWLVRKGAHDKAEEVLKRLTSKSFGNFDARKTVAMMEHTTRLEGDTGKNTSYLHLFHGVDRRRTEIACMTWITQAFCGANLMGYSTIFYQRAGLSDKSAFTLTMGVYAIGVVAGLFSWILMSRFGRRTLYITGQSLLFTLILVVGLLGIGQHNPAFQWAIGSVILLFALVYDSTVGPVCYSLVAELPSTLLKPKTIVVARMCTSIGSIAVNILTNYQLTTTAWNWGPFSAFFWAGTNFVCLVWMWFRLPEPRGRSYAELDVLFENGIGARRFAETRVDAFSGKTHTVVEVDDTREEEAPQPSAQDKLDEGAERSVTFEEVKFNT